MADLLVGRQPILDRKKNTIGYELLYRSVITRNSAEAGDGNVATSRVFANTMFEMGLASIVGDKLAFINFTRDFLVKDDLIQLLTGIQKENYHPEQLVLEILENIVLDEELFKNLEKFKKHGFKIALDDVASYQQIAKILPTGLADIVKVDLIEVDRLRLPVLVRNAKENGLYLLAEKVETQADYSYCFRLGFDFFQGYFFSKPETIQGSRRSTDASRFTLMRSLAATMDPMVDFSDLTPIISNDVGLSYKLLRLINSGYFSLPNQVKSIPQAISLIGMQQLRSWIMLLMMATVDNKPHELTAIALQRAKMCELVGKANGSKNPETCFLIGLLSVLDALLDTPMDNVVEKLNLANEVSIALVNHEGIPGKVVKSVINTEQGNWEDILDIGITPSLWGDIYYQSITWSNKVISEMDASFSDQTQTI
jgi:EAL and modified HD-GYP domain-containing signal transduction protein